MDNPVILGTIPLEWFDWSTLIKEDATFASLRIHAAALARDWTAAKEIIRESSKAEFYLFDETGLVPRKCLEIWLAALQRERPNHGS